MWSKVGSFNLGPWVNSLVEMWGWGREAKSLVDRSQSPWDDAARRASHGTALKRYSKSYWSRNFSDVRWMVLAREKFARCSGRAQARGTSLPLWQSAYVDDIRPNFL